ncbi:MAG: aminotransferase class IV [Clostridia bacterium]|nr:aminotransferase class IV [Clostridia bacterium]
MTEAVFDTFLYTSSAAVSPLKTDSMPSKAFNSVFHDSHPSLYEVIRIIDGKPLFFEEHFERLVSSAASIGKTVEFTASELRDAIYGLAHDNDVLNNNIKIVLNGFETCSFGRLFLYFIESIYPSASDYENGVKTALFSAVRENPNAKIINRTLRERTNAFIESKGIFEAILINRRDEITEGSRSNLFFIKNDRLYTSPAEGVLLGVTRKRIMEICGRNDIEIVEAPIGADKIDTFDAAFISGTSPKVLPVREIGNLKLDCKNRLLQSLMRLYDEEVAGYLSKSE